MSPIYRGIIAFFLSIIFNLSFGQSPDKPLTQKQVKALVDSISKALNRYYILPEKVPGMVDKLKSEFRKGSYKIQDKNALGQKLLSDLRGVNPDGHLWISYDPTFSDHRRGEVAPDTIAIIAELKKDNFLFQKLEILPANVGYLKFNGFLKFIEASKPTIKSAFRFLKSTDMIIIDLRENFGGSPAMVRYIESYFFGESTHIMDIVNRQSGTTNELWTNPADAGEELMTMPVYILTSKLTASGAEDFAYGMQTTKRAKIVGESTWGGAHPTGPYSIGQGFVASIPFARSLSPITKTDWEGIGVTPDIKCSAETALYTTQKYYLNNLLTGAKDDMMKHRIQWRLYKLEADNGTNSDSQNNQGFLGVYEGNLDFFAKDGRLWCKNAERGNELFQLKIVADDIYVLDENVIVEFVKNANGKFESMNMLWRDGWVTSKKKV